MQAILKPIRSFKVFLYTSFFLFLPINQKISTIIVVVLFITSLLSFKKAKTSFKKELILLPLFYLFYCLSLFYSADIQFSVLEKRASFLALPVIFMLDNDLKNYLMPLLKWYVYGCVVALFLCEINAFINSINFFDLSFNSRLDKNLTLIDSISISKNHFFSENFSFLHQTVYFSMYLVFGLLILICFELFSKKTIYILSAIFILAIVQILNKAGLVVLFVILGLKLFFLIKGGWKRLMFLLAFVFFACIIFALNPRLKVFNTNFIYNKPKKMVTNLKGMPNTERINTNSRILIWMSAIELIKENTFFGIGAGGSHKLLYERVAFNQQHYDRRHKLHAHNQYLQVFLDIGIFGFILFLIFFINLIKLFLDKRFIIHEKIFILGFILIIGINFMFESMFERYSGISFFCSFYCLIVSMHYKRLDSLSS